MTKKAFFASSTTEVTNYPGLTDIGGKGDEWKTYGTLESYTPGKFLIQTFNKISTKGLKRFDDETYDISSEDTQNAHAILLRSHKLQEEEVGHSVRAIARCGAGTNNVPVARMTELGIPVFNTPGANANAVKELVLCGMFLGSRRVIDGSNHMEELGRQGLAKERVEKDKSLFGGRELKNKTLAVIGLGTIFHEKCSHKYCIQDYFSQITSNSICLITLFERAYWIFNSSRCSIIRHECSWL